MRIIRNRAIVDDGWTHFDDGAPIPDGGDAIVSLDRFRAEHEALLARSGRLGVRLPNTTDPHELGDDLRHFALVAVIFPVYRDGRGFSLARMLRRMGYEGELRAIGNVLRDQLFFMERCGFDAYELQEGKDLESALESFGDFTVTYQDAYRPRSVPRRR